MADCRMCRVVGWEGGGSSQCLSSAKINTESSRLAFPFVRVLPSAGSVRGALLFPGETFLK